MIRYMLETNHVTLHFRGHLQVGQKLTLIPPDEIATTTITAEEHLRGRLAQIKTASTTDALAIAHQRFRQAIYDMAKLNILEFDSVAITFTCLTWLIKCCCILPKWRSSMVTSGHVKNGVIVLNNGVQLPEGQEVTVLVPAAWPTGPQPHSILDIAPVSLGVLLRPLTAEDDLLGEMLEGRS